MALFAAYVASSSLPYLLNRFLHNESISLLLFGKWPFFNLRLSMSLNFRLLPFLLLAKRLLLQRAGSNMVPFNIALEANNLGRVFDFFLALLVVDHGLLLVVGDKTKSTLVIGGLLNTQHFIKFGLPFMTFYQVFPQRSDLGLELFYFLYMVSNNTSTRGSRCYIVRATRHGK